MSKTHSNPDNQTHQDIPEICGIIMPISGNEMYSKQHWIEVKSIIEDVVIDAGLKPNLVSDADDVGIIHNRIVKNLAENPIVVCDVSSKNPNVMFELGLRLAFDKATIIIKDELTSYNFDTSPIEHLSYPSDLHYPSVVEFKALLKQKLLNTFNASKDSEYSTFLKNFVIYKRQLQTQELDNLDYISKQFELLNKRLDKIEFLEPPFSKTASNKNYPYVSFSPVYIQTVCSDILNSNKLTLENFRQKNILEQVTLIMNYLIKVFNKDSPEYSCITFLTKKLLNVMIGEKNTLEEVLNQIKTSTWDFQPNNS